MPITWIIGTVLVTLAVSKLYRLTPFHDPGSAIWHTPDEESMELMTGVFRRLLRRPHINIGDKFVARMKFLGVLHIVNHTHDEKLRAKLPAIMAAPAFVRRNPLKTAHWLVDKLHRLKAYVVDDIPGITRGDMIFVVIPGWHWMIVIRRHAIVMLRHQKKNQAA